MKIVLSILAVFANLHCFSQSDTSILQFDNPSSVVKPKGYSHAATIDMGNCRMVVLSGQVPLDAKGNLVGKDDVGKQTEQVFKNISNIISELGGTMDNVIRLGIYLRDITKVQAFRNNRDKFINTKNPPTSSLVEVNKLFRDDVLIEIEATAIIPKK